MVTQTEIIRAVALLKAGKLVAIPTETVYGLGADASNPEAVGKIFAAKGRPTNHPLIVHIAEADQLNQWAREISPLAWRLAKQFWPGPLTLILKKAAHVLDAVTGGQETIGLRVPSHPVAQAVLKTFGGGIAAPSANQFGHISPTQADHVKQELGDKVDLILDGGACEVGIESTIIDVSSENPRILRPGAILPQHINNVLAEFKLNSSLKVIKAEEESVPKVSGMLASHYAPTTPLQLVETANLLKLLEKLTAENKRVSVISHSITTNPGNINWYAMSTDPINYAHELYNAMRLADKAQSDVILIEVVPHSEEWLAILDRLTKAAAPK